MKKLGVTQRVEVIHEYGERRDCLDQQWSLFAEALGYLCVPLPNIVPRLVPDLLDALQLDGILLSGGNSLSSHEPNASNVAPERDLFEGALIDEGIKRDIPVVGVCRGLQMMNVHFGGDLSPVSGHAGTRHLITQIEKLSECLPTEVNSYHDWTVGPNEIGNNLEALIQDSDGNIEAFKHVQHRLAAIMWHPERETPFNPKDIDFLTTLLT